MEWTWELTDLEQNVLATLDDRRPGGRVELELNAARQASVSISSEDDVAALAVGDPMASVLRVRVEGWSEPLFCGRLLIPEAQESADEDALTLHGLGPLGFLDRAAVWARIMFNTGTEILPFTVGVEFANRDQSEIMWRLIKNFANGDDDLPFATLQPAATHRFGIRQGTLAAASVSRYIRYPPGKKLLEAITELSELHQGADFAEQPVIADDGDLVEFETYYPRQGSDLSATVVFDFGHGAETALAFKLAAAGDELVNYFTAITGLQDDSGTGIPTYVAQHAASIALYGIFEDNEQFSHPYATDDLQAISDYARSVVAANAMPNPFFDFTPAIDAPHVFAPDAEGGDYWLGDTVAVDARLRHHGTGESLVIDGRIVKTTLTEQESGDVLVEHSCAAEIDSAGVSVTEQATLGTDVTTPSTS